VIIDTSAICEPWDLRSGHLKVIAHEPESSRRRRNVSCVDVGPGNDHGVVGGPTVTDLRRDVDETVAVEIIHVSALAAILELLARLELSAVLLPLPACAYLAHQARRADAEEDREALYARAWITNEGDRSVKDRIACKTWVSTGYYSPVQNEVHLCPGSLAVAGEMPALGLSNVHSVYKCKQ